MLNNVTMLSSTVSINREPSSIERGIAAALRNNADVKMAGCSFPECPRAALRTCRPFGVQPGQRLPHQASGAFSQLALNKPAAVT
jgi:hypothetical protein